jgi:hypothetical protein
MDIFRMRTKLVLWLVPFFAILILTGSACARGLFGMGLPGLPSLGGFLGGPTGCGETVLAKSGTLSVYAGWMEDREGTRFTVDGGNADVFGVVSVQQQYPNRGLWLGISDSVGLGDALSFIASSWYLVPSSVPSRQDIVQLGASSSRSWQTDNRWWFADGLVALGGPGGLSALAGLRYDYFTTRFKKPYDTDFGGPDASSDVISTTWIPLFGAQYQYASPSSSLIVRAVGTPVIFGYLKYLDSDGVGFRLEERGRWSRGYFLEFFGEYSKNVGPGSLGVFARWNLAEGRSTNANVEIEPRFAPTATYNLSLNRLSWTLGGSLSLDFNLPI